MKRNLQNTLLKKLKNPDYYYGRLGILVIQYLQNRYDLNELFKLLYDKNIKKELLQNRQYLNYYTESEITIIDMESCPDKEAAKELIGYYIKRKLEQRELYERNLFNLVSYFKIYDENILKYCSKEVLIILYKEDTNDKLFDWILYVIEYYNEFTFFYKVDYLTKLRPLLNTEQKHTILNALINKIDCSSPNPGSSLKCAYENLLPEEFEYIRMRALNISGRYEDIICQFIYDNMLDGNKRKKHIEEIISHGYTKCGYKLLINANLTSEETEKLKHLLLKYKDEYYFYYLVKTNIKFLLNIFGTYISIEYFIKESFSDSEERKEVLAVIDNELAKEFENVSEAYEKAIENSVYKVKPKLIKKKRGR